MTQRSSLLGAVLALHAVIIVLVIAGKTETPKQLEMPLIVDLLAPSIREHTPPAKPQAAAKSPAISTKPPLAAPVTSPSTPDSAPGKQASVTTTSPAATSDSPSHAQQAVPMESAVSQARFDADYLKNPAPPYPPLSRRMGEEGKVILRVQVSAEGLAEAAEIKTSSGSLRLDEAALRTVQRWRFIPAKRGDSPVASSVLVPIIFKLEQ